MTREDEEVERLTKSMAGKIGCWAPECMRENIGHYIRTAYRRGYRQCVNDINEEMTNGPTEPESNE